MGRRIGGIEHGAGALGYHLAVRNETGAFAMMTEQKRVRRWKLLSWIMYGLAAALLIASILLGLSIGGASAAIPAATIGFQAPIFKPIWDALVSALQFLGVLVFGGGLVMAILLVGSGLMIGRIATLEQRVGQLEGTSVIDEPTSRCAQAMVTPSAQVDDTRSRG